MNEPQTIDVAIIGGGFTGAAVAYHLAHFRPGTTIAVIEPREVLGGGLAYDDADPAHRINVPAARMSLIPGDDTHFARWLAETGAADDDPDARAHDGALYPRRAVFGRYVRWHLDPLLAEGRVTHVRARAVSLAVEGAGWIVATDQRGRFRAHRVVLAATHPSPELPAPLAPLASDPRLVADALVPGALAPIAPDARVVILGTGLTMADVVASLDRQGHRGPIVALSRRGLRSRGHPQVASEPFGDFTQPPPRASTLLQAVRRTIRDAGCQGISWHAVIDAVRAHAQTFWPTLPPAEQSRIVRHLRVFWDVHRFRIAPQVEAILDRRIAERNLRVLTASVISATPQSHDLQIVIRHRRRGETETLHADHVIVTTGPAHGAIFATQPFLAALGNAGLARPDHLGLGISCDAASRALDASGRPHDSLFVAGPLSRATFGELMGLPQVSAHARAVADAVARSLYRAETFAQAPVAAK